MASIVKRNCKILSSILCQCKRHKKKQLWESFDSYKEASKRKSEVEYEMGDGVFIPPNKQTVSEFLDDFVSLYGEGKLVDFQLQHEPCADRQLHPADHRQRTGAEHHTKVHRPVLQAA